jgi:hypothetical protein
MSPVPEGAVHYMDLRKYVKLFLKKFQLFFRFGTHGKTYPMFLFLARVKNRQGPLGETTQH